MKNKWLIYTGLLTPIIFWITTIVCGLILGNYNHITRLVSELGAIGTKSQYLFASGLVTCSIFSLIFIFGLHKTAKQVGLSSIPIIILLAFSFSICGAALFPLPLKLHGILGMPSILLFLSPLSSLLLWKTEKIPNIKIYSTITIVIMLFGFSVYMPNFLSEYFGLKQRFFHVGWSIWFVYLSFIFIDLNRKLKSE